LGKAISYATRGARTRAQCHDFVGQVGNLRRIVNPPAGSEHNAGESPEKFATYRFVGQAILQPPF
jgi:hypothetical protein